MRRPAASAPGPAPPSRASPTRPRRGPSPPSTSACAADHRTGRVKPSIFIDHSRASALHYETMSPERRAPRPAVFMDRDGCLTEEVGYVNHPTRIRLLPRTAQAIRRLNQAGVPAVMVTNQTGIARGYFSEETLHATNARMRDDLATAGARLDGAYVCMHHPTEGLPPFRADCDCRKP